MKHLTVRAGDKGPWVEALQRLLGFRRHTADPGLRPDGAFGPGTEAAVRAFQEAANTARGDVAVDGIAGPQTWGLLRDAVPDVQSLPWVSPVKVPPALLYDIPFTGLCPGADDHWPVRSGERRVVSYRHDNQGVIGASSRYFCSPRPKGRRHCAVDLYANENDPIVAVRAGVVVAAPYFYRSTHALFVYSPDVDITFNYGEVAAYSWLSWGVEVGDTVEAGQRIAMAGMMNESSMTHFEAYRGRVETNQRFFPGKKPFPDKLLNPTDYLLALAKDGK